MKKYFLAIAILLGLSAKAVATTYYVDGASGSDGNAGTSTGAAWKTLNKASTSTTAGDIIYVKSSATYNEILFFRSTGTATTPVRWEGYSTTPGDNGRATIEGGNTRASCVRVNNCNYNIVLNFVLQGPTSEAIHYNDQSSNAFFFNCRILKGSGTSPASISSAGFADFNPTLVGCEISGFSGAGTGTGAKINPDRVEFCIIHDNTGNGVEINGFRQAGPIENNVIYSNGGKGIYIAGFATIESFYSNTIYNNSSDGIYVDGGSDGQVVISNNLITSNGGYGVNIANAPSGTTVVFTDKNFFYSNTSGDINNTARTFPLMANVTLTGSPYTSAGTGDFSLNNTAGAGAAVRSAAAYNAFPTGTTTSYLDGGAVQKNSAGGSTATVMTISVGGL